VRKPRQPIGRAQQRVHRLGAERQLALLRGHQRFLHRLRQLRDDVQPDNSRRAFERMGRLHHRLDFFGIGRLRPQFDQPLGKHGRLRLGLRAVKVEQRFVERGGTAHEQKVFTNSNAGG
jgi:hypothetical protein